MSWISVGIGVGGAALGAYGATSGKKGGYEYNPYGQLNPEQIQTNKALGGVINSNLGNAPGYGGQLSAAWTPQEQQAVDQQARLASMTGDWAKYYQPGQINPEVDANERRNLNDMFYGNYGMPSVKALTEEQYASPSSYYSSARPDAVMNSYYQNVTDPYQNWRSTALQNSYQNALNYAQAGSGINQANIAAQAVPREVQQMGLDRTYNEWIRKDTSNKEYIDKALNFLGIGTGTQTYKPAEPTFGSAFASNLGQMGMMYGMNSLLGGTGNSGAVNPKSLYQISGSQPSYTGASPMNYSNYSNDQLVSILNNRAPASFYQ